MTATATKTKTPTATAQFVKGKETKGAYRYDEVPEPGEAPMSGSVYLKKYAAEQLGNPDILTVTVTAG